MPALFVISLIISIVYMADILTYTVPKIQYTADNCYDETLTVLAREDFAPYSFVDQDGNLAGYNVEMINLLANQMQMNVDMKLLSRAGCFRKLAAGEVDIVCNANYNDEFKDICLLSEPAGRHRVVVFGLEEFHTIRELYGKKIATVTAPPAPSELRAQLGFPHLIAYDNYEQAFEAIMSGEADYVVGIYSILEYQSNTLGYSKIQAVSSILDTEAFAMGIGNYDVELEHRINVALAEIEEKGLYTEVADKWLGAHIESATNEDIVKSSIPNVIVLYTICMMFFFYFVVRPIHQRSQRDEATLLYDKVTTRKLIERKRATNGVLMVMDINKFKLINDMFGHSVGDAVILDVAYTLQRATRNSDIAGRIGGDEFVLYLPAMETEEDAMSKAIQIRDMIYKKTARNPQGAASSVSIGIAFNRNGEPYDSLFVRADKALYRAKKMEEHIVIAEEDLMA